MNPSKIMRHKILLGDHLPQTYQIHNCSWSIEKTACFFQTEDEKSTLIPGDFKEIPRNPMFFAKQDLEDRIFIPQLRLQAPQKTLQPSGRLKILEVVATILKNGGSFWKMISPY